MKTQTTLTLSASVETVTPAKAKQYLQLQESNRQLMKKRVDMYAADMVKGSWHATGEAIKFDTEGRLVDGQHRLHAVIKAGVPVELLVVRNCPVESVVAMDSGQSRNLAQAMRFQGQSISTLEAAIARAVYGRLDSFDTRTITRQQTVDVWQLMEQSIRFAANRHTSRAILFAPIRSLIARAHYCGEDAERLARFLYVMDSGFADESEDTPAISLRMSYQNSKKSTASRAVIYSKAITALDAFLKHRPVKKLNLAKEQLWVIPEIDH